MITSSYLFSCLFVEYPRRRYYGSIDSTSLRLFISKSSCIDRKSFYLHLWSLLTIFSNSSIWSHPILPCPFTTKSKTWHIVINFKIWYTHWFICHYFSCIKKIYSVPFVSLDSIFLCQILLIKTKEVCTIKSEMWSRILIPV